MIFITAKFTVLPEFADQWLALVDDFTQATRAEEGCLWFEWSRSARFPQEYYVVEAFRDQQAGVHHVQSEHFQRATQAFPKYLMHTPQVINVNLDQEDWSELGEMRVDR